MRLGFVSARAASGREGLWTDAGLGRLVDALMTRASVLTVALSHFREPGPLHDHRLLIAPEDFIPLPPMSSFQRGVFHHRANLAAIRAVEARSDVVLVQLPFAAPTALLSAERPRVYHVCADLVGIVRTSPAYHGVRGLVAVAVAESVDRLYRRVFDREDVRLVTNGRALLDHYAPVPGVSVVSSALTAAEIGSVTRSRAGGGFRILFVGHLRPEKGVAILIDAFEEILRALPDAELHVVGPTIAHRAEVAADLDRRVKDLSARGRVTLVGPKAFGPPLFECFANADVLALPSLMEGTPRVLVEARAFGCPVVASRVGGVPTSVEDGVDGLLVPPGEPSALCAAILRIARDWNLRDRLVRAGLERARRSTVDAFADVVFEEARQAMRPPR